VKRRVQKQKQALCGVVAVNNAPGKQLSTREHVDMQVHKLGLRGDSQGNYSTEVLHLPVPKGSRKGTHVTRHAGGGTVLMPWLAYVARQAHALHRSRHNCGTGAGRGEENSFRLDAGGLLACLNYGLSRIWKIESN
jgi:hypothetical protein